MVMSEYPSKVSLPQTNPGVVTVLEYLVIKFPYLNENIWRKRIAEGKVHRHDGSLITPLSPFQAHERIYYYREVDSEPCIPFAEEILFQNEHILVVHKPHFLAITPGGIYVNECLQNRLRRSTSIDTIQALHRIDRVTAGIVMFSVNPESCHLYHHLFAARKIQKTYQAIAKVDNGQELVGQEWEVKNQIVHCTPRFRMRIAEGQPNSHSVIRCIQQTTDNALFELNPITGKTHQLRLHMQSLGLPILNDKYYPQLQPLSADDYSSPLQLLAKKLQFIDPITQQALHFSCEDKLVLE